MADFMILSKRIRKLRLINNLTAREFGDIFNISYSSVSLYENGKRVPNINLIIKIANYFNVSTDYLLGVTSMPHSLPSTIENSTFDIGKAIENVICLADGEEKIVFNDKTIDKEFFDMFKKSLANLIETYASFYNG